MFSPEERLIFPYEVRGQKRFADPLAVWREFLRASGGRFAALCRQARDDEDATTDASIGDDDEEAIEARHAADLKREAAREKLYAVLCSTFGLVPFDPETGKGVTEAEVVSLLNEFLEWSEGNGRPGAASPEAAPSTATPPVSSSII